MDQHSKAYTEGSAFHALLGLDPVLVYEGF